MEFNDNDEFFLYIGGFSLLFFLLLLIVPSGKGEGGGSTITKTFVIEAMTNAGVDADLEAKKMSQVIKLNAEKELENMKMDTPESSFCEIYKGKSDALEEKCNTLSTSTCNLTSCCVYMKPKSGLGKCVAGDVRGPTYKTDSKGNLITSDSYYYQNKQMKMM